MVFWGLDIVLSFFTGYVNQGNLVLNRKEIARQYLKPGFCIRFLMSLGLARNEPSKGIF